jgi:oligopeptide/dipeptide ABC transporter ATP-binding protein
MSNPLLEVEDLTIQYRTPEGDLTAVSGASFTVEKGEYFGLVGESGCGKSTIAKALMGALDDNGRVVDGTIRYEGEQIQDFSERQYNDVLRWKEISWVPQGSMESLDPLQRIKKQALEIAEVHTNYSDEEALSRIEEAFEVVGLQKDRIQDYPHQFSGGMQQRAIIALAIFLDPSLIIADEPTTALDVLIQDQIFKYLDELKRTSDVGMILITHDISLVFESCEQMAIMHSGQVAERGLVTSLYEDPGHPYSILLQRAFPDIRYPNRTLEVIDGYPPETYGTVDCCTFADRCPWAVDECRHGAPPMESFEGEAHEVACIRADEIAAERADEPSTAPGEGEGY